MSKLLSLYGLKFHPFRPDVPHEALFTTPAVDSFVRRVELSIADGGFAMLTGDPGTGKSIALRLLAARLRTLPDLLVGTIEHPQSRTMDFYRELGDLFSVPLASHNRWAGFKALRSRWADHIGSSRCRPVLIIDEAQEALTTVLCELRILASKDLDSKQLLCVIFAGDARLPERLRSPDLLPLGSRIRRRLTLDYASRDELLACLDHLLSTAGNPSLMTTELRVTLVDHAAGNYRVLMNLADELLTAAVDRELPRLDEKLFLEVYAQTPKPKPAPKKKMTVEQLRKLLAAPEIITVDLVAHALVALRRALITEHPLLVDELAAPDDPPARRNAREILRSARQLRRALRAYRKSVDAVLDEPDFTPDPF